MLDKERILAKLDELDSYLDEVKQIAPRSYKEYEASLEKRRACERLLHISFTSPSNVSSTSATSSSRA